MSDENELFKDIPTFSEALGNLVKFTTKAMGTLDKSSPLWAEGDKALSDFTLAALRNLVQGAKSQQSAPPEGHDPYSRS